MATDIPAASAVGTDARSGTRLAEAPARLLAYFQPPRRRALALIMLLAGFLDFWNLQRNGYANAYYAAAVKSMLQSWHNFFFVSFDPGGFVTVDKPPLGFWIQTASAKIFGFSGFSILLPEALAGALSVGVLYLVVRRVFSPAAGLLAALALAVTPISVVTNRNNTIDSLLVLTSLLAAYAITRAVEHGSLRWLLLSALLVGLGFNIKMLEAYLIVPALAAAYFFAAPISWRARLGHLALAGLLMLVVSLSWVTIVDLTPASMRPYVGSSQTNSELELALGYNGIQRLTGGLGHLFSGGATSTASGATTNTGPGGVGENGQPGIFRLLNAQLGGQASWLLALGAVGLLASGWTMRPLAWLRRQRATADVAEEAAPRTAAHVSPQQGAWVLWGLWTLTQAIFFSVAGFFHTYYLSMLAPGVAALAGIGAVELWHDYRRDGWRTWLAPLALVMTALVQAVILANFSTWSSWMTPLIGVGSLVAAAALVWLRLRERRAEAASSASAGLTVDTNGLLVVEERAPQRMAHALRWQALALSLGLAILLIGPLVWTSVSLAQGAGGSLPSAGPSATASFGGGLARGAGRFQRPAFANGSFPAPPEGGFGEGFGAGAFAGGPPVGAASGARNGAAGRAAGGDTLQVNSALVRYLEAHQGSARYLLAVTNANSAAPYILATGKPVMALGGFLGSDPILTLSQLKSLVASWQVRYFLLSGGGFGGPGGGSSNSTLTQWVTSACTVVPASAYSGSSSATSAGGGQLYVCGG
ncbi:MAG TPA: glycosyltransferase family 39 protein [Ktedonobacterales bacterium]